MFRNVRATLVALVLFLSSTPCFAQWSAIGPSGGGANLLAASSGEPGILLAGTRNALLYRSSDRAQTWQPIPFDRSLAANLNALISSPCSDGTFYAGTTDPDRFRAGLYKIERKGSAWNLQPLLMGQDVMSITVSPVDCRVMAAGTLTGVMLSHDMGATWKQISPADPMESQPIVSLAFSPDSADVIYAGTPRLPWKTMDGGLTWHPIHVGIYDDSDIFSLVVDDKRLLIGACSGIYKSSDEGVLWQKVLGIPGESRRTYIVKVSPSDPQTIYAGTSNGLWKSVNAGGTWIRKSPLPARSIVIDARNSRDLVVATDTGIWRSKDGGDTLGPANSGFVNRSLGAFLDAGDALLASTVYEVGFGALLATKDGGVNWTPQSNSDLFEEHVFHLVRTPNSILAAGLQHVLRSSDEGKTWKPLPLSFLGNLVDVVSVPRTRTVLFATHLAMYAARDDGSQWRQIKLPASMSMIDQLKVASSGSTWGVLAAGRVFLTSDEGESWSQVPVPEQNGSVYDFALRENQEILVGTLRGLLYSFDFGQRWTEPSKGLNAGTVTAVLWHPLRRQLMFSIQNGIVWKSQDSGASWDHASPEEIGRETVSSLHWGSDYDKLYAIDFARGISVLKLNN